MNEHRKLLSTLPLLIIGAFSFCHTIRIYIFGVVFRQWNFCKRIFCLRAYLHCYICIIKIYSMYDRPFLYVVKIVTLYCNVFMQREMNKNLLLSKKSKVIYKYFNSKFSITYRIIWFMIVDLNCFTYNEFVMHEFEIFPTPFAI